jgi:hypothetical protein
MPHKIEVFVSNCFLCRNILNEIEAGKCAGCQLIVHNLTENVDQNLVQKYKITVVPTIVIDGKIKIEGRPDIPFICSDETYRYFERKYSLKNFSRE